MVVRTRHRATMTPVRTSVQGTPTYIGCSLS